MIQKQAVVNVTLASMSKLVPMIVADAQRTATLVPPITNVPNAAVDSTFGIMTASA